ncbi:MAG: acyl-ACP--UDP-N-acetylglucosamine O-acyltransferase [Pirellulaceae bacterium]|nr:acyl-ACP--UDP-N-acetylglucosamine O-acyltransferase [Pirellulaceae bacterium]
MKIHPTAVVSPEARIGANVEIGPMCVVEPDTQIGDDCVLHGHVTIKRGTTLGQGNRVFESAVLGGFPQHVHMPERPGRVVIGDGNTIRENVTIHRALHEDVDTIVGNNNLFMVNTHVAHDCVVGSNVIVTNNAMLGGHVHVEDRAYVSGGVAVHQFCRIGTLAMVGGQSRVTKDVPPYVTVDGLSSYVVGLNQVGLRRAGYTPEQILQLKTAYRVLYRNTLLWEEILSQLKAEFPEGPAAHFHEFCSRTKRGIVPERRMPPGATIKLRQEPEQGDLLRAKAG